MKKFCRIKSSGFFKCRRIFSLFSLITFLLTNHFTLPSYAAPIPHPPAIPRNLPADLKQVQIPEDIGRIQDFYQGKGDKAVVLVQDAHAIPDAQRSIQKIIDHFQRQYGIGLVALEGASQQLDPQIFRSFPDKEILKKTFDEYFDRGELTGSVAAAIFDQTPGIYRGIEDWPLYEDGLGLYLKAMNVRAIHELPLRLKFWKSDLAERKRRIYSKQLLEIDQALGKFQENHSDLMKVLRVLKEIGDRHKQNMRACPLFLKSLLEESDSPEIEREVKKLAEQVKKDVGAQLIAPSSGVMSATPSWRTRRRISGGNHAPTVDSHSFNQQYQAFQTSQISASEFALYLKENFDFVSFSSRLSRLISNQRHLRDIEGLKFFKEFEAYAQSVKESLFRNDEERKLDHETRQLYLATKLAKLELSREEWEELKQIRNVGAQFIAPSKGVMSATHSWRTRRRVSGGNHAPTEIFQTHFAFYRNAEKRDRALFKNLLASMNENKRHAALLVAGGFHTDSLTRQLKEKGISYLLLTPRIDSVPESNPYREHMEGKVSWANYFRVKNGKIDLYEAFVRAARDRLLNVGAQFIAPSEGVINHVPTDTIDARHLLKSWRDQIIRNLAEKEQITRVSEYTPFLDELTQDSAFKTQDNVRAKWQENIARFLQGLRVLHVKNQLTGENIFKLLSPSTIEGLLDGTVVLQPRFPVLESLARPQARREKMATLRSEVRVGNEKEALFALINRAVETLAEAFPRELSFQLDGLTNFYIPYEYQKGQYNTVRIFLNYVKLKLSELPQSETVKNSAALFDEALQKLPAFNNKVALHLMGNGFDLNGSLRVTFDKEESTVAYYPPTRIGGPHRMGVPTVWKGPNPFVRVAVSKEEQFYLEVEPAFFAFLMQFSSQYGLDSKKFWIQVFDKGNPLAEELVSLTPDLKAETGRNPRSEVRTDLDVQIRKSRQSLEEASGRFLQTVAGLSSLKGADQALRRKQWEHFLKSDFILVEWSRLLFQCANEVDRRLELLKKAQNLDLTELEKNRDDLRQKAIGLTRLVEEKNWKLALFVEQQNGKWGKFPEQLFQDFVEIDNKITQFLEQSQRDYLSLLSKLEDQSPRSEVRAVREDLDQILNFLESTLSPEMTNERRIIDFTRAWLPPSNVDITQEIAKDKILVGLELVKLLRDYSFHLGMTEARLDEMSEALQKSLLQYAYGPIPQSLQGVIQALSNALKIYIDEMIASIPGGLKSFQAQDIRNVAEAKAFFIDILQAQEPLGGRSHRDILMYRWMRTAITLRFRNGQSLTGDDSVNWLLFRNPTDEAEKIKVLKAEYQMDFKDPNDKFKQRHFILEIDADYQAHRSEVRSSQDSYQISSIRNLRAATPEAIREMISITIRPGENIDLRIAAIKKLTEIAPGDESAVSLFGHLLKDKNLRIRFAAVRALRRIHSLSIPNNSQRALRALSGIMQPPVQRFTSRQQAMDTYDRYMSEYHIWQIAHNASRHTPRRRSEVRAKYEQLVQLRLDKEEIEYLVHYLNEAIRLYHSGGHPDSHTQAGEKLKALASTLTKKIDPKSKTKFGEMYARLLNSVLQGNVDGRDDLRAPDLWLNKFLANYQIVTKKWLDGDEENWSFEVEESRPRSEVRNEKEVLQVIGQQWVNLTRFQDTYKTDHPNVQNAEKAGLLLGDFEKLSEIVNEAERAFRAFLNKEEGREAEHRNDSGLEDTILDFAQRLKDLSKEFKTSGERQVVQSFLTSFQLAIQSLNTVTGRKDKIEGKLVFGESSEEIFERLYNPSREAESEPPVVTLVNLNVVCDF